MASSTLFKNLPKFGHFGAAITRRSTTSNTTLILASNPKFIHTNLSQDGSEAKDAINPGANEGMMPGENMMKDKAYSTAEHVSEKTKDMAGMVSAKAHAVSAKAKQAMEAAWDSAKDTAQRAKDTLVDTANDSKQFVKANVKSVEKSMNTKNHS
ncbi:uncharacterized protein At4g13230-like [Benincasa hispida]|uniref:uncharacterized protein At4g13230-like n=1 Tax=Benincasa hispida TaxID=102211 RepID=UPI0019022709|nr:uncharacterized protein At4g13230-like [Benincasa hispida]